MFARHATQGFEMCSPRLSQPERVRAAVTGPRAALNQALLLESVKQQNQPAGEGSEMLGQRSLRHVRLVRQIPENPRLRGGQAKRGQPLGKAGCRMCTDLSEQERGAWPAGSLRHSY
jgi:hypothetical protein